MTKMMVVNKQFLRDIYGTSFELQYEHKSESSVIKEIFTKNGSHSTAEHAYSAFVLECQKDASKKIERFEELSSTFKGRLKLFRHSLGLLPAKNMKYLTNKLDEIKACREETNIPSMESLIRPLGNEFLISEAFIRPEQKLYVFVKAHSIHFESFVYEAYAHKVNINVCESVDNEPARITMKLDIQSFGVSGNGNIQFFINWDDFKRFNDDYLTTNTTGEYVFVDKEKCLAFAKEMMNKDIQKLQTNMNTLTL